MIIYMYKEKGIGYIYAFFNGHGYTCQCRVNASVLEELYCSSNGNLPLEEYIRSHGVHIRRNSIDLATAKEILPRELVDKFQFFPNGNYVFDIKEVKSNERPISTAERHRQSWFPLFFRRFGRIPARQTRI